MPPLRHLQILDRGRTGVDQVAVVTDQGVEPDFVVVAEQFVEPLQPDAADFADLVLRVLAECGDFVGRRQRAVHVLIDKDGVAADHVTSADLQARGVEVLALAVLQQLHLEPDCIVH